MDIKLQTVGEQVFRTHSVITLVVSLSDEEIDAMARALKSGGTHRYNHYLGDGTKIQVRLQPESAD